MFQDVHKKQLLVKFVTYYMILFIFAMIFEIGIALIPDAPPFLRVTVLILFLGTFILFVFVVGTRIIEKAVVRINNTHLTKTTNVAYEPVLQKCGVCDKEMKDELTYMSLYPCGCVFHTSCFNSFMLERIRLIQEKLSNEFLYTQTVNFSRERQFHCPLCGEEITSYCETRIVKREEVSQSLPTFLLNISQ